MLKRTLFYDLSVATHLFLKVHSTKESYPASRSAASESTRYARTPARPAAATASGNGRFGCSGRLVEINPLARRPSLPVGGGAGLPVSGSVFGRHPGLETPVTVCLVSIAGRRPVVRPVIP